MKKGISCFLFVLMIAVFLFHFYFGIAGAIDIRYQYAELAARGASGHEYFGIGIEFLVFRLVLFSMLGFVISFVSYKLASYRSFRIVSAAICSLCWLPLLVSACVLCYR